MDGNNNGKSIMMNVRISRCVAWAPNLSTDADWQAWSRGERALQGDDTPRAQRVPAMLRRRLTRWGRLALEVAGELTESLAADTPIIFSSRHGDTHRTETLLTDLANCEPLSPTAFSLSVHNAPLGLYTIVEKITSPSLAVAAGRETFAHAWLEAYTWLQQGASQVLLVHADELLADFFRPDTDEQDAPLALALLLTADEGSAVSLRFDALDQRTLSDTQAQPLAFLQWWYSEAPALRWCGDRLCWQWQRSQ
ncbi:3-oxoacyl-ACP synthase [Cellvibrio sp. KB43]|uniref:3-oxoacyl-ACP synthase n=2 Tax=Cellvibrio polysaccharolyticus TaxID=2082724 RepID=A0A928V4A0_9GAMM|nr:3-oxoacyl-ACP synthase [Cellvibrio polysaccharolyticus]